MKINLSIFIILICFSANAQIADSKIKTYNDQLLIGLFVADNYATNTFQFANNEIQQIPTLRPTVGFQFAYNGMVLAVGTGVPFPHPRYEDSEHTEGHNIAGYFMKPKFVLWGAARYFEKFEYNSPTSIFEKPLMLNLAGTFTYILNDENYSFRAAFRQSEQQQQSGGSWLMKTGVSINNFFDSTLVTLRNDDFRGFNAQGAAVLAGYGYTLNLNKEWYVSVLFLGGLDFHRGHHSDIPRLTSRNPPFYSFAPTYDFKAAMGYNSDKFYVALLFDTNHRLAVNNVESIDFIHRFIRTDLRFGIRIGAPEFLTKIRFLN